MSGRVTSVESRQLGKAPPPNTRVTEVKAQALGNSGEPNRRFTEVKCQAMGRLDRSVIDPGNGVRPRNFLFNVSAIEARVMFSRTPDFRWIEMLVYEVFPFDISYSSIGATRFTTDVTVVDSGDDQRNARWSQPLMEYDVAYGVRTMEQLQGLIAFFRAVKGRLYSFLYLDNTDYKSTQAVREEARSTPDTHWTDQPLGTGDGLTKVFQLQKKYETPMAEYANYRPIYKPKDGTVQIGVNGNRVLNWTVDRNTGKVTFTSPLVVSGLTNVHMEHVAGPTWKIISTVPSIFAGFSVGDKIVTWGWVNPLNNSQEKDALVIGTINAARNEMTFTAPLLFGAVETALKDVNVMVHPAPKAGTVLTAGFEFYVPVRFDTDRLPVSLDYYGIGGAADVKLVEVRPQSE
ncbi:DUF2460 domain-containing protein [Hyphomicrobium sp.]|uniref:DUF2460 domain-containing protein n=1 Tax=Hyphomicrobium sp. TaxID=82 RepID=UPI001DBAA881|nr:DUF2460 domain-containing protein [Hyphomicrobium sp.]MBY0560015.1 DUF2460 domain-containing protein [Hyphomicrobium sp.]